MKFLPILLFFTIASCNVKCNHQEYYKIKYLDGSTEIRILTTGYEPGDSVWVQDRGNKRLAKIQNIVKVPD